MRLNQIVTGAVAALALAATAFSADAATVIVKKNHRVIVERGVPARYLDRGRVMEIVRARHIRFVGQPYMYRGYYVLRCYDRFGRLAYCRIHPRTGAFLGISVRL